MAEKMSEFPIVTVIDGNEFLPMLKGDPLDNARVAISTILAMLDGDFASIDTALDALAIYDIGGGWNGKPAASAVILRFVAPRAIDFTDEFPGSVGKAGVAATASTVFSIQKNGVEVGTMTFAAAGTTPTFATTGTGTLSFAAGDVLTVVAPASADATLADIAFTIIGKRV